MGEVFARSVCWRERLLHWSS